MDPPQTSMIETLKNPKLRRAFINKNRMNMILYFAAIVVLLFVYHVLSDGDFSFLLTMGSLTRLFAFLILAVRVTVDKNCSGLSLKTLELYCAVFFCRLMSILFYEGYLPYDSSGDWFYLFEFTSFGLTCFLIYAVAFQFKESYNPDHDAFGKHMKTPAEFGGIYLAIPCLLLAIIVHPTLNQNFLTDTSWTFALYLETLAMIPQLYMFQKSKTVEPWTSHFVFTIGLSRMCLFTFWLSSYHELNDRNSKSVTGGWVGIFVLVNQIVHLLVMGDFCYYYLKSAKEGSALVLPGQQV